MKTSFGFLWILLGFAMFSEPKLLFQQVFFWLVHGLDRNHCFCLGFALFGEPKLLFQQVCFGLAHGLDSNMFFLFFFLILQCLMY